MASFPIPDAALDDRLGFVGTSGSGKTYNAGAAVERLLVSGARVVIVDPLDVWWGLRLSADGKREGFKLPIFGGAHGDLPLNERAGKLIGETVASMSDSCIVSLGEMPTKEAERRFMLDFLETLYRKARGNPFHVVFDEADLWAPQGAGSGSGPMLQSLMEQIVRRGRVKGFIPWLITQRPAVISKDVLSQVDGLVTFKLTSSHDRKAIGEWVKGQADLDQWNAIWASLPAMQQGEGVVWVPARGLLATVKFPLKQTFDSSRAPKRGESRETRDLKPLDIEGLKGKLATIEEDAKANDPAVLKAEVQRLTRELAKAERTKAAPPAPVIANTDDIENARADGEAVGYARGVAESIETLREFAKSGPVQIAKAAKATPRKGFEKVVADVPGPLNIAAGVDGPGQRLLNALGWWKAFGFDSPTNEQVSFIAGYSPTSGGYKNPRSALKTGGYVEYPQAGRVSLTDAGAEIAEVPDTAPTGEELRRRVLAKLDGPQQRILSVVLEAYPDPLTNDEAAARAGYSPTSGGYKNPRSSLRTLSVIDYPASGQVRAADWLFP